MLSNKNIKFIKSLQRKKIRDREGLFVLEGGKNIMELLHSSYQIEKLLITDHFFHTNKAKLANLSIDISITSSQNLEAIGTYKTNESGLAVVRIPEPTNKINQSGWLLVLDEVKDPGNLGTIIRTADWFGINQIICSPNSVDLYNAKVINATMGSFARVSVAYLDLIELLEQSHLPVYGALLEGASMYDTEFAEEGILVLGNESQGISRELIKFITYPVKIPRFGQAESLNVGIATGIFCAYLRGKSPVAQRA